MTNFNYPKAWAEIFLPAFADLPVEQKIAIEKLDGLVQKQFYVPEFDLENYYE